MLFMKWRIMATKRNKKYNPRKSPATNYLMNNMVANVVHMEDREFVMNLMQGILDNERRTKLTQEFVNDKILLLHRMTFLEIGYDFSKMRKMLDKYLFRWYKEPYLLIGVINYYDWQLIKLFCNTVNEHLATITTHAQLTKAIGQAYHKHYAYMQLSCDYDGIFNMEYSRELIEKAKDGLNYYGVKEWKVL